VKRDLRWGNERIVRQSATHSELFKYGIIRAGRQQHEPISSAKTESLSLSIRTKTKKVILKGKNGWGERKLRLSVVHEGRRGNKSHAFPDLGWFIKGGGGGFLNRPKR